MGGRISLTYLLWGRKFGPLQGADKAIQLAYFERLHTAFKPSARLMRQLSVLNTLRLQRLCAQSLLLIFFVLLEVTGHQYHLAISLKGADMGGDAVQEPAVVADDKHAAGKV